MLTRPARASSGFSLIELMVVITLIGIGLALAVPTFGKWSADARVRAAAESLVNAIRLTQATAVSRGRTSLFALTTDTPPTLTSTAAANSPNWFAELNPLSGSDETQATLGLILKSTEGTQHAITVTGPAVTCFSATGRQLTLTPAAANLSAGCTAPTDDVASPTSFTVAKPGAATRSFKVLVYLGGRVRMCDVAKTLSSTNPDGCP
ncbi:MAG: prepilin-type N-terminal cleavage/methylation domain-containing protein [Burkholderiaceae bacterium]